MTTFLRARLPRFVGVGLGAVLAGCGGSFAEPPGPFLDPYLASPKVIVSGYTFDPEAMQYSFGMCGAACPQRPQVGPGQTHYERALVAAAEVQLVDRTAGGVAFRSESTAAGVWRIDNVAREPRRLLYTLASKSTPDAAGSVGPAQGPVPQATTYFPTLSISPAISPGAFQCLGRPAAVIGNSGILDAVARHLTNLGTRTVAGDFVRPSKFGGAIIWWAYAAGTPTLRQGADGTALTASSGQVIPVQWGCPSTSACPPGSAVPAAGLPSKSPRNFYVLPGAATSNIGVSVTLLPPVPPGDAPQTVSFSLTDPVTDPTQNRPFAFTALPDVTAVPGKIVFGEAQARPGRDREPAGYECSEHSLIPGTGALAFPAPAGGGGAPEDSDAGSAPPLTHVDCMSGCHQAGALRAGAPPTREHGRR